MEPVVRVSLEEEETVVVPKAIDALKQTFEKNVSITKYVKRHSKDIYFVLMSALKKSSGSCLEDALSVLGQCLNNNRWIKCLTDEQCELLIEELCLTINNFTMKTICSRALWCFSCQRFDLRIIKPKIKRILVSVSLAISESRHASCSVACEAIMVFTNFLNTMKSLTLKYYIIWWERIIGLLVHPSAKVRGRCLKFLIDHKNMFYKEPKIVSFTAKGIRTKKILIPKLLRMFNGCQDHILEVWKWFIIFFGDLLHRGCTLINALLEVIQKAFTSKSDDIQIGAYANWKLLIDNFASDSSILCDVKRLNLLLLPLRLNRAQSEEVLKAKINTWWHLIVSLGSKVQQYSELVVIPLITFCCGGVKISTTKQIVTKSIYSKYGLLPSPINNHKWFDTTSCLEKHTMVLLRYGIHIVARLCQVSNFSTTKCFGPFLIEPLSEVISGSELFEYILQTAELVTTISLVEEADVKLLSYVWECLIDYASNRASSENCSDEDFVFFSAIFSSINKLYNEPAVNCKILFEILEVISFMPNILCKPFLGSLFEGNFLDNQPLLILMRPMLLQSISKEFGLDVRFMALFTRLIKLSFHSMLCTLKVFQYIVNLLEKAKSSHLEINLCCQLWLKIANCVENFVSETGEVNEGNTLEHDFGCMHSVLMFPYKHLLWNELDKDVRCSVSRKWFTLFETFITCSSSVLYANPNAGCFELISKLNGIAQRRFQENKLQIDEVEDLLKVVGASVRLIKWKYLKHAEEEIPAVKVCRRMVTSCKCDFSSVFRMIGLILNALVSPKNSCAIAKLLGCAIHLLEILNKIFIVLQKDNLDVVTLHFSLNIISTLEFSLKSDSVFCEPSIVPLIDELWMKLMRRIAVAQLGPYNSSLLKVMMPLLKIGLRHPRECLRVSCQQLWRETFASSPLKLFIPEVFRKLLNESELISLNENFNSQDRNDIHERDVEDGCSTNPTVEVTQECNGALDLTPVVICTSNNEVISQNGEAGDSNISQEHSTSYDKKITEEDILYECPIPPCDEWRSSTEEHQGPTANINNNGPAIKQNSDVSSSCGCDSATNIVGREELQTLMPCQLGGGGNLHRFPVVELQKLTSKDIETAKRSLRTSNNTNLRNEERISCEDLKLTLASTISTSENADLDNSLEITTDKCQKNDATPNGGEVLGEVESSSCLHIRSPILTTRLEDEQRSHEMPSPKRKLAPPESESPICSPSLKRLTSQCQKTGNSSHSLEYSTMGKLSTRQSEKPRNVLLINGDFMNDNFTPDQRLVSPILTTRLEDEQRSHEMPSPKRKLASPESESPICSPSLKRLTSQCQKTGNSSHSLEYSTMGKLSTRQSEKPGNVLLINGDFMNDNFTPDQRLVSPILTTRLEDEQRSHEMPSPKRKRASPESESPVCSPSLKRRTPQCQKTGNSLDDSSLDDNFSPGQCEVPADLPLSNCNIAVEVISEGIGSLAIISCGNSPSTQSDTEVTHNSFTLCETNESSKMSSTNDNISNENSISITSDPVGISAPNCATSSGCYPTILKESEFLLCNEQKNLQVFSQVGVLNVRSQPRVIESDGSFINSPKESFQESVARGRVSNSSLNETPRIKTRSASRRRQTRGAQLLKLAKNIICTKNGSHLSSMLEENCSSPSKSFDLITTPTPNSLTNDSITTKSTQKCLLCDSPQNKLSPSSLKTGDHLTTKPGSLSSPLCNSPCSPSGILKRKKITSDLLTPSTPNKRKVSFADPVVQKVTYDSPPRSRTQRGVSRCLYMTRGPQNCSSSIIYEEESLTNEPCQDPMPLSEASINEAHGSPGKPELNHTECISPELVHSDDAFNVQLPSIASSLLTQPSKEAFIAENTSTIEQLGKLTESEIDGPPTYSPKVNDVCQVITTVEKSSNIPEKEKKDEFFMVPQEGITAVIELPHDSYGQSDERNNNTPDLNDKSLTRSSEEQSMPVLERQDIHQSISSEVTEPFHPLLQHFDSFMENFTIDCFRNVTSNMMVNFHTNIADRMAAFSRRWLMSQNGVEK